MSERRLVVVHAHPDDECISTGGIMARYATEGTHVCLVTCTNGEVGEIADLPELGHPDELRPRLGEVRIGELNEACRRLGVTDVRLLGYHDSGMDGTADNESPVAFVNQDMDDIVGKITAVVRDVRPQVVVTYNEIGFYGHPDHIRTHRATVAAVEAAANPARYAGMGEPWRVAKLYYTAIPQSRLRMAREVFGEHVQDRFSEEAIEQIGTPDEAVTTYVDVGAYVALKFLALEAHRTQLGTTGWFLSIPSELRQTAMGTEAFVLAVSALPAPTRPESDLFEGLGI